MLTDAVYKYDSNIEDWIISTIHHLEKIIILKKLDGLMSVHAVKENMRAV